MLNLFQRRASGPFIFLKEALNEGSPVKPVKAVFVFLFSGSHSVAFF